MPVLFVFLLKVNIALIVFCLGYYAVLRRLTFYTLNRLYLGIAIVFSSVYPLIDLDAFAQRHQQLAIPVQNAMIYWKAPTEEFLQRAIYWHWATIIFWIGAALFTMRLCLQILSLYKLHKRSEADKLQGHDVRITTANISPFSFWQSIYINPDNLGAADLKSILEHEQIHVSEWHTIDILLTELSVIFYWFNPGVWLIKRAVRENIEFITDRKILQKGIDSKAYQYSLLNVSFNNPASTGIANHFNISMLKKRIIMMNAKRSATVNLTRYAFLVPLVLICLLTISLSKAELVKKGKVAYKAVTASVKNLTTLSKPTAINDTVKKHRTVNISISTKIKNDSNEIRTIGITKPDTIVYNYKDNNGITTKSLLYVVDGVPASGNNIDNINPDNIQSIDVHKNGASFTNAYGIRAANGVIVINTKRNGSAVNLNNEVMTARENKITIMPGAGAKDLNPNEIKATDRYSLTLKQSTNDKDPNPTEQIKKINGLQISPDGKLTNNGQPITKVRLNGVTVPADPPGNSKAVELIRKINGVQANTDGKLTQNGQPITTVRLNGVTVADYALTKTNTAAPYSNLFADKVLIIDGKEADGAKINNTPADNIKSITINKAPTDADLSKYGDKAKNGIITITTKEQ